MKKAKYKITITALFLILILAFSTSAIGCGSASIATASYWSEASVIVKEQIEECGRPYSELLLEIIPDMATGEYEAVEKFFLAAKEYYPVIGEAILDLSKLNPPNEETAKWQEKQLESWSLRQKAFYIYMSCWDYQNGIITGTEQDLLEGDRLFEESQAVGKEADKLQREMIR